MGNAYSILLKKNLSSQ